MYVIIQWTCTTYICVFSLMRLIPPLRLALPSPSYSFSHVFLPTLSSLVSFSLTMLLLLYLCFQLSQARILPLVLLSPQPLFLLPLNPSFHFHSHYLIILAFSLSYSTVHFSWFVVVFDFCCLKDWNIPYGLSQQDPREVTPHLFLTNNHLDSASYIEIVKRHNEW